MSLTTDDRVKRRGAKHAKPNGAKHDALVSAVALARHLCCARSHLDKLVDQRVIERLADGRFDQDACRAKYLARLREQRKLTPRSAADTAFTSAKTALVQLRVAERAGKLIPGEQHHARVEAMLGLFLSALSSLPAQCAPIGDHTMRRLLERWVIDARTAIANAGNKLADEAGEPKEMA
jgi:hypothetical protein